MTANVKLGRIAGVRIGANWSLLIIFGLVAGALSASYFPNIYPDRAAWLYALAGLSVAVVFFVGLVAHELSHAIVAKRNGMDVDSITLWMLGGVAWLRGQPRTPGAQLRIAGIGPLVSLIIGLGFGLVCVGLVLVGQTGIVFGAFVWLAAINIVLAVFNLLPATPLDGGRLLNAVLWRLRGDRSWAAVVSARAGEIFGAILIALGLWEVFAGWGLSGLWLTFIGWFVLIAAKAEEQQARTAQALANVRIGEIMSTDPVAASVEMSIAEFVDAQLRGARHSVFPLLTDGRPDGLLTLGRIRKVPQERWPTTRLRDIAEPIADVTVASPDELVPEVLLKLSERSSGHVLILSDGELCGVVSPSDISRAAQHASLHERVGLAARVHRLRPPPASREVDCRWAEARPSRCLPRPFLRFSPMGKA